MRVKTVPRQRVSQGNRNGESVPEAVTGKIEDQRRPSSRGERREMSEGEKDVAHRSDECTADSNGNRTEDRSSKQEQEEEALNYSEEVLDMSIKHKIETPEEDSVLLSLLAGPSCKYSDSHSEEDIKESSNNDDNNNTIPAKSEAESSAAGSSGKEDPEPCENKLNTSSANDEDTPAEEAVNLCKKDCHEEDSSNHSVGSDERLKDTFLYKIMTDPTFLENMQKHKKTKRFECQFCKQEFSNSDELADHMEVKKNESNQVVCCACKKTFAQKRYLRYHQRCHSEKTMFTCDICTKKYTRIDNLSRHNTFHVNPDKFSCTYCEKTFARKDLLNKHLKCHDHANKYRFFCKVCQKYFKGPLTLDNHKKNFHGTI